MKFLLLFFFIFSQVDNCGVLLAKDNEDTAESKAKEKIINEFREKLLNEQEIKKELQKNITLTNEDLEGLKKDDAQKVTLKDVVDSMMPKENNKNTKKDLKNLKEEQEKLKKEENRLKKEAQRLKKEEERIKKEEAKLKKDIEKADKGKENEALKKKRETEEKRIADDRKKLEESKKKLEKDSNLLTKMKAAIFGFMDKKDSPSTVLETTTAAKQLNEKSGVLTKTFNITDTGVSEEFLYTKEYQALISNKTTITKVDTNKETDIPIINVEEKNIINFKTSDIPPEILSYRRTEENRHIPTVILTEDLQSIARRAIMENNLSVLRGIIEQTKDPDFFVAKNVTMLTYAIENQKYILVRYLLYSGASINRVDKNWNNPLHISIINHNSEIANLLINNGVDINAQNVNGETPLMIAIMTSQDAMAVNLIKNGADLKLKNTNGESILDLCDKNRRFRIKQYIKTIMMEEAADGE